MIPVLYADEHLLAVNKPGGLAVLPDRTGDPSLLDRLREQFPTDAFLELPHRLDRPVSGVVLVARTPVAITALGAMFAGRSIRKTYWAIVHGTPALSGCWEHRLEHDVRAHKARISDDAAVEPSRTHFERLAAGERYALMELLPEGGHFHQLRVQCAGGGHPIKGDVKYGARRGEPDRTIALHARALAFAHPFTGTEMRIEAPPPSTALWDALLNIAGAGSVPAP